MNLRELWSYRDLLWILVERNIKVIHKQTALGMTWVALQPLIAAAILAMIAGRVAKLPSDGTPHLLFVFCGLTIWNYFSQTAQRSSTSLINNAQLVSKVYFPRMLIPLSHTFSTLVDFAVTLVMLFVFMAVYHIAPTLRLLAIPGFLFLTAITATGVALWFSSLSVKYRDTNYALPLFLQIWMYASAVIYPTSMIDSPRMPNIVRAQSSRRNCRRFPLVRARSERAYSSDALDHDWHVDLDPGHRRVLLSASRTRFCRHHMRKTPSAKR